MAAHTARFDEQRNTIDDQYPVALQQFFSPGDWSAFVQEINGHGEQHNLRCQEIAEASNYGCWYCCLCLCCICGPCIFMYKVNKTVAESMTRINESLQTFEDGIKASCRAWQERYGNQIGITLKSEEAQRITGSGEHMHADTYRKYWLECVPVAVAQPPMAVPVTAESAPVAQWTAPAGACTEPAKGECTA